MRKTFKVEALKNKINGMIRDLPDADTAGRETLQTLIENVLMESGNYSGFQYLSTRDMESSSNGTTVGINDVARDLPADEYYDASFKNVDRTRVKYF